MMYRMTVAALGLLLCAASTFAQTAAPGSPPSMPAPRLTDPPTVPAATAPDVGNSGPAFWADGDALFSWFRGVTLPPLLTTSPPGTPTSDAGVLGKPGTRILFGGNSAEDSMRYGFRVAAGYWFGSERTFGIEAGYMVIDSRGTTFATSSQSFPILARPYVDATSFTPQALLLAFPGLSTDSFSSQVNSGHFYSGNIDVDFRLVDAGWFRLIGLAGYRYYRYDESLGIQQTILPTSPLFVAGTQIAVTDHFATQNTFQGLDLGVRPEFAWEQLTLDFLARATIGNQHHVVNIAGQQVVSVPGFAPLTNVGGLYALNTNIGRHTGNDWAVTPEVGAGIGWRLTPNVKVRVGYGLLYLNGVTRAPDQVNTVINPLHLPGLPPAGAPLQPTFFINRTDIWIQNVSAGLEITF
jgi:opacity protein-like surface antigen